jgi:diacylglycerol O-acyltransferase / wax synthase
VNDVVLSAIAAALHRLLLVRGEQIDQFVISVPFSARREASVSDLGNRSGVVPLRVSAVGDPAQRLESLAERTRAARQAPPGASTALLGPFFRLLAATGRYRWFIDRQRLIHTFVSNLRGPESRLSFLHRPITRVIPLSGATGNITVSFAVLSYAGSLTITLISDPDTCPDVSELRDLIEDELQVLTVSKPQ